MVHDIICASNLERKYPTLYKHVLVSPFPKVHPPEYLETGLRQISDLPVLGKAHEMVQIMLTRMRSESRKIKMLSLMAVRPTVSALVNITQTWLNDSNNTTEGEKAIHFLFIDFSKAFDLVDHSILLSKLTGISTGLCGNGYKAFSKVESDKLSFLGYYQQRGLARRLYHKDLSYPLYFSGHVNQPIILFIHHI